MKKTLILTSTVVCIAWMAQAASINWGVGNQQIKDWNGVVQLDTVVELIFIGNTDGPDGEWVYQTRTSTTQTTVLGGKVGVSPISPSIFIGQEVAGSGQNLTTGTSEFIIRIWNMTDTAFIDTTAFTFNAADDSLNLYWAAGSVSTAGAVNKNIQNDWGTEDNWTPVPEPTSLALLLVGVGAVALRRRILKK